MHNETKNCLFCGNKLQGRVDKKFCDDQCRTNHNNRLKADSVYVRNINQILRKNRAIIEKLVPADSGKIKLNARKLHDSGFNFSYHTHIYTTKTGTHYTFCYEFGYLKLDADMYMLVKRSEENG